MLCTRCHKRTAVVFVTAMQGNEKHNEGFCLSCARELGIPQIREYIDEMGIDEDMIDELSEEITLEDDELNGDSFSPGGTAALPGFIQSLFSGIGPFGGGAPAPGSQKAPEPPKEEKKVEKPKKKNKFLDSYCTNLTEKAINGKMDIIIGRDKEIARVIQILSRRQKNNPCLIGEPGVGKTAIAEGIAQRIVSGDVPSRLLNKKVYLLDMTAIVAGTQYRGQFESRMKGLIDEVRADGNVILFADEVHNLVGAGDAEGSMNAANILKPALSRGEVQLIGATTFKEYRKYIEKDSALERRFQPVTVEEPSVSETELVLAGIAKYYEEHHRVKITDAIVHSCAVLSERYINDRFLPDKAIDLLDESCACAAIRSPELSEFDKLEKSMSDIENDITTSQEAPDPDYEHLTNQKYNLSILKQKEEELRPKAESVYVTQSDLAKVIELWTGIPSDKVNESEYKRLGSLESILKSRIIGQDAAVELVVKAIKRTRVQLSKRRRPASFIFVGPTGVGKTELVKVLANELFNDNDPLIRLDMTEFMEKHTVSRLVGSPPGYVGYDDAGQLTEKVRRKPYSVILFDEIEKAHPDVMNLLLQILDEGKIKDAQGRSINFENTVIAMTSNAGSTDKSTGVGFNKTVGDITKEKALNALNKFLRPEFLGRIDEVVVFNPLSIENYKQIASLMLEEMREPLKEKGISLSITDEALTKIAEKSHGGKYGARDIRKFIRENIEDKTAEIIIESIETPVAVIDISVLDEKIAVTSK
ncbi:MAG: ATP-dependent Clp protease ATP-binding subunit [Ruminococcus sp.]|nr:ATP-dependent Clp protease ATP-binding subunit [Ruminococcus sp.]